jgi:hypothetical protein
MLTSFCDVRRALVAESETSNRQREKYRIKEERQGKMRAGESRLQPCKRKARNTTLKLRARRGHASGGKANGGGAEEIRQEKKALGGLRKISQA